MQDVRDPILEQLGRVWKASNTFRTSTLDGVPDVNHNPDWTTRERLHTRTTRRLKKDSSGKTEDTMKYKLTIMTLVVFCAISPLTTVAQEVMQFIRWRDGMP